MCACGGSPQATAPAQTDDAFLDALSHQAFQYFWEQADPNTGLVRDRARADGTQIGVASTAATGFGLGAFCIGAERQWIPADQARARVQTTLLFFAHIDFRGRQDKSGTNFFSNSVAHTRAHRAFCLSLTAPFPSYHDDLWGITASDSANRYIAWGGPPMDPRIDGTVVPSAAGGSLMFTLEISIAALRAMEAKYGSRIYGRYGFVDAFNPTTGWVDSDVIGIDLGITLFSAENERTGNAWKWFMANPEPQSAMKSIGFS